MQKTKMQPVWKHSGPLVIIAKYCLFLPIIDKKNDPSKGQNRGFHIRSRVKTPLQESNEPFETGRKVDLNANRLTSFL